MFRLTRQVRFAINSDATGDVLETVTNGNGGYPSLGGLGYFFALDVTVAGELDPASNYLVNIKNIDRRVRDLGVKCVAAAVREARFGGGGHVVQELFPVLDGAWPAVLEAVRLWLSPFFVPDGHFFGAAHGSS